MKRLKVGKFVVYYAENTVFDSIKAEQGILKEKLSLYFKEQFIMTDLKHYIVVKEIDAKPMTLGDFNDWKGQKMPPEEDPNTEGYFVVYPDGYKSWSPKSKFEDAYREVSEGCMSFGLAVEALKLGKCVARKGWNGKGLFVCKQVPANIEASIVPKMQSLPQSAKDKLNPFGISYRNQMLIINADRIADSWVASSSDIFADDWFVVE